MSPAYVLEPTYRRLKRAVIEGTWPGGTRLEALRLADGFGVSMTPVRDSLNQLVGEGLVDLTPGEGFRVPHLTEQGLRNILSVNAALLEWATDSRWRLPKDGDAEDRPVEYPDRIAAAFSTLAAGSANRFLVNLVSRINDRLHLVRTRELEVFPNAQEILEQIEVSLQGSRDERHRALRRYHHQCQDHVPELIGRLSD